MSAGATPRAFNTASTRASCVSADLLAAGAVGAVAETPRLTVRDVGDDLHLAGSGRGDPAGARVAAPSPSPIRPSAKPTATSTTTASATTTPSTICLRSTRAPFPFRSIRRRARRRHALSGSSRSAARPRAARLVFVAISSASPEANAPATQCLTWSSRIWNASDSSAVLTAAIWVRTSMQ